jgi:hypothetical protein
VTVTFEPARGRGPLGTGVYLLRRTATPSRGTDADAWLALLFLPILPLGRWSLEPAGSPGQPAVAITRVERPRVGRTLAWIAGGLLVAALAFVPAWAALTVPTGSKAVELGGIFLSLAIVVFGLGWLDQSRERVPLRAALRAWRGAD